MYKQALKFDEDLTETSAGLRIGQELINATVPFARAWIKVSWWHVGSTFAMLTAALDQPQPRTIYRKQFQSRDGRDWVAVSAYASWPELDKEDSDGLQRVFSNFESKYKEMYGDEAWLAFGKKFDEVVISREDEWQQ